MSIQPGTPLPWGAHQGVCEGQETVWDITSKAGGWTPSDLLPEGYFVATVHETRNAETAQKDASYIVHACNTFPELVEALEDTLRRIDESDEWWMDSPDRGGMDAEKIRAALAKARGQA